MADWGAIEKAGEFAWTVLKDGKPTSEAHTAKFRAVPQGVDFTELENAREYAWETPFYASNLMGIHVVDVRLAIVYEYGATYKNGGLFLPSVMVVPREVSVLWGFGVDLEATFGDPYNVSHEHNKPIAAVQLALTFKVSAPLQSWTRTLPVEIRGDGSLIPEAGFND